MDQQIPICRLTNPVEPPGRAYPETQEKPSPPLPPEPEVHPRHGAGPFGLLLKRNLLWGIALLLIALTVGVYYPMHHFPFISINDGDYVTNNLRIQQLNWQTVRWSFTTFHAANWHPLTWLSHAVDVQLFALNPAGHHESNLLLHVLNVLLLFWVLWRATDKAGRSFMVAALFALHPINVESVAWIAERKNLLSMFFLLLALGAYQWYASKPRIGRYNVVAALFVLGLMAKPQVITLPFLLLLWDYWPLERIALRSSLFALRPSAWSRDSGEQRIAKSEQRLSGEKRKAKSGERVCVEQPFLFLVLEKLPLLAFSAASALLTLEAQRAGGAMGGIMRAYPLSVRLDNAIVAYVRYLGHAVWPAHLAIFYPHVQSFRTVWPEAVLLAAITVLAVLNRDRRYLAVGWLWFLGTLVPMIGVVQVGGQAMADRYGYLSFVGLFIAVCWGVADWAEQWHVPRAVVAGTSIATLVVLMVATHRQLNYWSSDVSLWSHAVEVTKNNAGAENVLGEALVRAGRGEDAMIHFRRAAVLDPLLPYPHFHIGAYDEDHGDLPGALEQFRKVIAVTQNDMGVLASLRATTFVRMSSDYEALGDYEAADKCVTLAVQEEHKGQKFDASDTR